MSVAPEAIIPEPLIKKDSPSGSRLAAGLLLGIFTFYLLLNNPYWVRHGDSEVFLTVARNLATGNGYRFNGQPVAIVPPGWPLILAGAMKISPSFSFLKMLPLAATVGFLLVSYLLLLRWTSPLIAALCVGTAALLEPVFSLSFLFFSDALFALLAVSAIYAALRISDGADSWPRIALLVLLCAAAVTIRWAALPFFAVIGAAVLHGELKPRMNRRWIAFALSFAATLVTFIVLRLALKVDPSQLDARYDRFVAGAYDIVSETRQDDTYLNRIVHFGEWIGGLFWRPAQTYRFSRPLDNGVGWIISLLLIVVIVRAARKREWLWLGGAGYVAALGVNWPDPISRYIIPLAPFILFGTYQAITLISRRITPAEWPRLLVLNLFFASILGLNGFLYLVNVAVMRARDFYEVYQGGVHRQLIDAAYFLRRQPQGEYEIAISQRMVNFDRASFTDGFRRALHFLSSRDIVTVPEELSYEPDAALIRWLRDHNVRYYLYQPPIWLIEHFRPRTRGGDVLTEEEIAWRLYEIRDGKAVQVMLRPIGEWPRSVPGILSKADSR